MFVNKLFLVRVLFLLLMIWCYCPCWCTKRNATLDVDDKRDFRRYWSNHPRQHCYLFEDYNAVHQAANALYHEDLPPFLRWYLGDVELWTLFNQENKTNPQIQKVWLRGRAGVSDNENNGLMRPLTEVCLKGRNFIVDTNNSYKDVEFDFRLKRAKLPYVRAKYYLNVIDTFSTEYVDETDYTIGEINGSKVTLFAFFQPSGSKSSCRFVRKQGQCGRCTLVDGFTRGHIRDKVLGGFCKQVNCECETIDVNGVLRNRALNEIPFHLARQIAVRPSEFRKAKCNGSEVIYPNHIDMIAAYSKVFEIAHLVQNSKETGDGCMVGKTRGTYERKTVPVDLQSTQ